MREPLISEALDFGPEVTETVKRDPSYPDRARIDSDVRDFLRPVSTPWIVFDRDSRVDDFAKSALRIGAIFASSPSFRPEVLKAAEESGRSLEEVAAMPLPGLAPLEPVKYHGDPFHTGAVLNPATTSVLADTGVFPPATSSTDSVGVVEPSNVVVARDVAAEPSSRGARPSSFASNPFVARPRFAKGVRVAALALACGGVLALVGVSAVTLTSGARSHAKAALATEAVRASVVPAVVELVPLETEDLETVPATPLATSAEPVKEAAAAQVEPKKRFGRLTIRSEAKHKNVWFDGKRMLGTGQRSFLVFCGMHTIAVADKADAKDVEIPCDGEYSVSR